VSATGMPLSRGRFVDLEAVRARARVLPPGGEKSEAPERPSDALPDGEGEQREGAGADETEGASPGHGRRGGIG
jgi:hypothetical protein